MIVNNILSLLSVDLLAATIRIAAPIVFGAIGEVVLQRSGIFNLGMESMYIIGAFFGVLGAYVFGNTWVGLLTAMVAGSLVGLLYGFIVITLRADQSVTGIAFIVLGYGLTSFLVRVIWGIRDIPPYVERIATWRVPVLGNIPVIGDVFFNYNPLVYLAYLSVIAATFFLFRTTWGLRLRSVGEHPKAATTIGIDVIRTRYAAAIFAGCMAAIGGAMLSLTELNMFVDRMSGGRGFFAMAAVIFGGWHPVGAMLACLLFGVGTALQMRLQVFSVPISSDLLIVFPYILTLLFVIFSKSSARPQSLGQPFQKESSID